MRTGFFNISLILTAVLYLSFIMGGSAMAADAPQNNSTTGVKEILIKRASFAQCVKIIKKF